MTPKDFWQAKLVNHWLIKQEDDKHNDVSAENKIKNFFSYLNLFECLLLSFCELQLTVP